LIAYLIFLWFVRSNLCFDNIYISLDKKIYIFLSWSSHGEIEKPIWFTRHRLNCGIFLLIGSIFFFNLFSVVAHNTLPSASSYSAKPIAYNFKLLNVIELPKVVAKWTVTVDIASNQDEVSSIQKLTVRSFLSFSFPKFQSLHMFSL